MRGNYNMRISEMKTGGLKIRIENLKTEKVAVFEASKKAILNGKLFFWKFSFAINRTLAK